MNSKPSIYLSGSIEYSKSPFSWRNKMYKDLHRFYNVIIPDKASDCPFSRDDIEFKGWMKEKFVMPDMVHVATSQYFFAKIDKAVFDGAGTISEITTAAWLGKNMMIFIDKIKNKDIPSWTLGCLDGAEFVGSIEEAIEKYTIKIKSKV